MEVGDRVRVVSPEAWNAHNNMLATVISINEMLVRIHLDNNTKHFYHISRLELVKSKLLKLKPFNAWK